MKKSWLEVRECMFLVRSPYNTCLFNVPCHKRPQTLIMTTVLVGRRRLTTSMLARRIRMGQFRSPLRRWGNYFQRLQIPYPTATRGCFRISPRKSRSPQPPQTTYKDGQPTSFGLVEGLTELVERRSDGVFAEHRHLPLHEFVVENHFDRRAKAQWGGKPESRLRRRKTARVDVDDDDRRRLSATGRVRQQSSRCSVSPAPVLLYLNIVIDDRFSRGYDELLSASSSSSSSGGLRVGRRVNTLDYA